MELTDLATIRTLCEKYDFALSKGFGQNFIVNPGVPPKIVDAAGIDRRCGVLEIGPGIGVLTREIARRAGRVVAIEVDKRLPPVLEETLAGFDNVKVVLQDVLKADLRALMAEEFAGMPVAVCANLPYYITSPIIMNLLEAHLPITSLTVMVQKEAAARLCAEPGSREVGAVSIAVRYYSDPKILFQVSRGSFLPAPDVDSTVIRLDVRDRPPVEVGSEEQFFKVVRAAFSQRRKTLPNTLSAGLGIPKAQAIEMLEKAGIPTNLRAEQLTLDQFALLSF